MCIQTLIDSINLFKSNPSDDLEKTIKALATKLFISTRLHPNYDAIVFVQDATDCTILTTDRFGSGIIRINKIEISYGY